MKRREKRSVLGQEGFKWGAVLPKRMDESGWTQVLPR